MAILVFSLSLAWCAEGQAYEEDSARFMPSHSRLFVESRYMVDMLYHFPYLLHEVDKSVYDVYGLFASYVPGRMGYYGGLYIMLDDTGYGISQWYPSVVGGAVLRPFKNVGRVDCQLYGGLALGKRPGVDVGVRLAAGSRVGRRNFGWFSLSLGFCNQWEVPYWTAGFSVGLTALKAIPLGFMYLLLR